VKYLNSSQLDKETIARNILAQDGVRNGLVCVLSCIEPCWKFEIHRNRMTKKLELKLGPGKCLFLDPGKTVVLLQVIETSGLHLSHQPFPSVQADLILMEGITCHDHGGGQCPIAQTKRHHRAKLCRRSSVTLLENSSPRHGHEQRAHFARRDHHARAKPA
jgi:hypothetical protein